MDYMGAEHRVRTGDLRLGNDVQPSHLDRRAAFYTGGRCAKRPLWIQLRTTCRPSIESARDNALAGFCRTRALFRTLVRIAYERRSLPVSARRNPEPGRPVEWAPGQTRRANTNASTSDGPILMALSTRACRNSPSAQSLYTVLVDTWRYAATSLARHQRPQPVRRILGERCENLRRRGIRGPIVPSSCERLRSLATPRAGLIRPSKPLAGGSSPSRRARKCMNCKREARLANPGPSTTSATCPQLTTSRAMETSPRAPPKEEASDNCLEAVTAGTRGYIERVQIARAPPLRLASDHALERDGSFRPNAPPASVQQSERLLGEAPDGSRANSMPRRADEACRSTPVAVRPGSLRAAEILWR